MKNQSSTLSATNPATTLSATDQEIVAIAKAAFIYGLPLVLIDLTKQKGTNYEEATSDGAPINQFCNKITFPTDKDTSVVRPNCDTFYSSGFLDLLEGPLVMSVPETDEQYYMLPLLDAYANCIEGSPGTRTGETEGGNYLIVGPSQEIPADANLTNISRTIYAATNMVWIIGRFQVDNPDLDAYGLNCGGSVQELQQQLALTPLSAWGDDSYSPPNGTVSDSVPTDDPNDIVYNMSITDYFERLNDLLIDNPPSPADAPIMEKFKLIGIGKDAPVPFQDIPFSTDAMTAMEAIPQNVLDELTVASSNTEDTWTGLTSSSIANYGTKYLERAMISYIGLGANLVVDATYFKCEIDDSKNPLNGSNNYLVTLPTAPPNNAFWSLTLYNEDGLFVDNAAGVYALGHSENNPLVPEGGPYTIYVQSESPGEDKEANWLPSIDGQVFNLMLRVYWPDEEIYDDSGDWNPPSVELNNN